MKTSHPLLFLAVLLAVGGCQSTSSVAPHAAVSDITVNFSNPEKFTDVRESFGGETSQHYLDQLSEHLKQEAALRLKAGEKLTVTFTDIDLAGDFRPDNPKLENVRLIKSIYAPHMTLEFKWQDAGGTVIREGTRQLSDSAFDQDISIIGRDQPLFFDKQLLDHWLDREFNVSGAMGSAPQKKAALRPRSGSSSNSN